MRAAARRGPAANEYEVAISSDMRLSSRGRTQYSDSHTRGSGIPRRRLDTAPGHTRRSQARTPDLRSCNWTIEVVPRRADVVGFTVLPRHWVVERTLAWANCNSRLAKDFEATIATANAWLYLVSLQLLLRRLARA